MSQQEQRNAVKQHLVNYLTKMTMTRSELSRRQSNGVFIVCFSMALSNVTHNQSVVGHVSIAVTEQNNENT